VYSVGIDLLNIDRFERVLARRPRLAARLFTGGELAYANARARPALHLSARFCAKEAVAKAFKLGIWNFHEIEVCGGGQEAPHIRLHGEVARRADAAGVSVEISLTHTDEVAGAVAMIVKK
jgi:holo-[acyl-carrier protein] synthase